MKLRMWMAGAAITASAPFAGLASSASADPGSNEHWSIPAEGSITCGATALTITGGDIDLVEHISVDGNGVEHRSGSVRFVNVTLTDGATSYRARGAGGSGGTEGSDNGRTAHLAGHFTIHDDRGQLFGRVAITAHVYRDGTLRTVDLGTCQFDDA